MTALDILIEARNRVHVFWSKRHGFGQVDEEGYGPVCAIGAINVAAGRHPAEDIWPTPLSPVTPSSVADAAAFVAKAAGIERDQYAIEYWNDTSSHDRVLEAFDKAIKLARNA